MKNKIFVETHNDIELPFLGINSERLADLLEHTVRALELSQKSITLVLCTDNEIQEINREYRDKDYPTDVISFAYTEEPFPGEEEEEFDHIGDIFLSMEKAQSQSIEYGVSFEKEIKRLLVHSTLHLIGYDHERSEEDELIMFEREDEVLSRIEEC